MPKPHKVVAENLVGARVHSMRVEMVNGREVRRRIRTSKGEFDLEAADEADDFQSTIDIAGNWRLGAVSTRAGLALEIEQVDDTVVEVSEVETVKGAGGRPRRAIRTKVVDTPGGGPGGPGS